MLNFYQEKLDLQKKRSAIKKRLNQIVFFSLAFFAFGYFTAHILAYKFRQIDKETIKNECIKIGD